MKLMPLILIAASAISVAAQSNTQNKPSPSPIPGLTVMPPGPIEGLENFNLQIGCPVAFTDVALKRDARYMPVKQGTAPDSSLAFKFKNLSGKQIESISVRVEVKAKRSIYDLDAATISRDMTLTGKSGEILPLNMLAYGLVRVTLQQITYAGGEVWTPGQNKNCAFLNNGSSLEIESPH
jgi:hypothetical protein